MLVVPLPVFVAPLPVFVVPLPVFVVPLPVFVVLLPVFVVPLPVFVVPLPVFVVPLPVFVVPLPVFVVPLPVFVVPLPVFVVPLPVFVVPLPVFVVPLPVFVVPLPVFVVPLPVFVVFPLALVDQSLCVEAMHSYKMALLHVCVQKYLGFRDWKFVVSTFFNGLEVCLLMCFSQTFQVTVNYYLCELLQAAYERLPDYMGFLLVQRLQSAKISEWCSVLRFLQLFSLDESLVALLSSLGESVTSLISVPHFLEAVQRLNIHGNPEIAHVICRVALTDFYVPPQTDLPEAWWDFHRLPEDNVFLKGLHGFTSMAGFPWQPVANYQAQPLDLGDGYSIDNSGRRLIYKTQVIESVRAPSIPEVQA